MNGDPKDAEFTSWTDEQRDIYRERRDIMMEGNKIDLTTNPPTPREIDQVARQQARELYGVQENLL